MSKKVWGVLVGAAIIIILIAFIYFNQRSEGQLKIGAVLPLSGDSAYYGEQAQKGMEIAKQEMKEKYPGLDFDIIYEDSFYNATEGVNAYKKLRQANSIEAVIPLSNSVSLAIEPISNNDKIIEMAIATSSSNYAATNNFSFRTTPDISNQASLLADYIKEKAYKRIGFLTADNDFGISSYQALRDKIGSCGGNITIICEENFPMDSRNFISQLSKLKLKNPNAVFIVGTASNYLNILNDARKIGFNTQFISVSSAQDPVLINNTNVAEGLVYSYYPINIQNPSAKLFIDSYRIKYNNQTPDGYAAEGYEAVKLIVNAFSNCNQKTACAKNYLHRLNDYPSVFGNISFDSEGSVDYQFVLKSVKNGEFVNLE